MIYKPKPPPDEYRVIVSYPTSAYYGQKLWVDTEVAEGLTRKDAAELVSILLRSPKYFRVELRQTDAGGEWVNEEEMNG